MFGRTIKNSGIYLYYSKQNTLKANLA
ncbi:hypothetical protein M0J18_RS15940 [Morganella morganii]|nr:hypothetical protein [Morganella morganii]